MTELQKKRIRDLGRVVTGKTPPTEQAEYFEGEELFVSPKDLSRDSYYVETTQTQISEKALEKFRGQVIPRDAVMFTSLSFAFGKMGLASRRCMTNQQINSVVVNEENAAKYVYYLLRVYEPFIFSYNSGIDTPIVPKSVFENIPVLVPKRDTQRKIAATLSAYDDLIANNRRRIALLERMAEEIYREWFVRLRFPGAPYTKIVKGVPDDWTMEKLPIVANITYGFPFAGDRFNNVGMGKMIVRIRDVLEGSSRDFTDEVGPDKCLVKAGDLLIGMDGEFHMNHWVGDEAWLVQRVCKVAPKEERLRGYLALALGAPIKHYEQTIVGATVGHLGAQHLTAIDVLIPPASLNEGLLGLNAVLDQKLGLAKQCLLLAKTRDALLPRLISGMLKVDHLDIGLPPPMLTDTEAAA